MTEPEQQIAEFLEPYREEIRSFAQELRIWLKKETKPAYELAGMSAQSFNIGYGFTTAAWDCFCAIIVYRNHINISLPSGASLADPDGLLHGTGSRIRHLKIKSVDDLKPASVRKILSEARTNALNLAIHEKIDHKGVKTMVKKRQAKKN